MEMEKKIEKKPLRISDTPDETLTLREKLRCSHHFLFIEKRKRSYGEMQLRLVLKDARVHSRIL